MEYLAFNEVGVTIACLAGAFTFIVLTWNAIKAIKEWIVSLREPTNNRIDHDEEMLNDHEQRISHLEECCNEVTNKLQSDFQWQQDANEMNRLMLRSVKHLIQHAVDGNNTQKLEAMEQEIDEYLLTHTR